MMRTLAARCLWILTVAMSVQMLEGVFHPADKTGQRSKEKSTFSQARENDLSLSLLALLKKRPNNYENTHNFNLARCPRANDKVGKFAR
ncbi:hypothetical protein RUM43_003261 [Polyplax serrata]|uniref:Uncharacterized protein n=1 Tax=Polyplax serrata TaxID=468196 RepID=A0AAN8NV33_POLSC